MLFWIGVTMLITLFLVLNEIVNPKFLVGVAIGCILAETIVSPLVDLLLEKRGEKTNNGVGAC